MIRVVKLRTYEDRSEWPLALAALLFLASYRWLVLDPSLDRTWRHALGTVDMRPGPSSSTTTWCG